jgi:hypothetical protein
MRWKPLGRTCSRKRPDEFIGRQRDRAKPLPPVAAIILAAKGYATLIESEEATVGYGDAVGVAGEIGEHCLGSGKRRLGVDEPCDRRSPGKENGM